ncbi:MAG: YbaB/EbfC family nucleoid-associated protein [Mailhella sp.]|jgi:DNA-binding YbaB/EbfC family protein|nr:YbaB/EbfC family nucleoid-associated protein [Mailhella sp.]MBQ3170594.1 YbaB/EbfC family nucleoid-associated protein [Mailhella sp.]MBQ4326583.1 YbaB/EbfC family nucleoid-associated protein [Mailhella sp.]MBQ8665155.1 YbaB/EbfC family nucleoid-associated protein [Mailhella sp.]MBR6625094.1 YbaB/EbfC family nucleoid-associated protein [Mailhella sp.]
MKNMNDLLRQAQVMQNKIARLQQEMAEKDVEASAGGGMVKVVMNGRQEMKSIVIDKAVMESGDNEMLQDLVMTAVNEAVRIGRANLEREMANISGGIRLPGMF